VLDILTGRCTVHGWLSEAECKAGFCLRCDEPGDALAFDDEYEDEIDVDFWETFYADV
jgi:hypothetical protein